MIDESFLQIQTQIGCIGGKWSFELQWIKLQNLQAYLQSIDDGLRHAEDRINTL